MYIYIYNMPNIYVCMYEYIYICIHTSANYIVKYIYMIYVYMCISIDVFANLAGIVFELYRMLSSMSLG